MWRTEVYIVLYVYNCNMSMDSELEGGWMEWTLQLNESRNEPPIRKTNLKYYETDNPDMRRTACISQAGQPQVSHRPWREALKQKKKIRGIWQK